MVRLLDAYQVGAVFGVNEATVRRWVAARLLPFIRTADGYRFREEDEESAWIRPGWFVAVCGYGRCREAAGFRSREKRDRWAFDHGLAGHMVRFFCGVEEGEGEGSDVVPA